MNTLLKASALAIAAAFPQLAAAEVKIAMIMPGPITDADWNSVGYNGLKAAEAALGATIAYSENVTDADAERVMRDYASQGYDLVFAHSFSYGDATLNVAEDFPKTVFMAGTAQESADNVGTYSNPDYQGAYVAGMLAAGTSKSGVIGWVGGMPAPNMLANLNAYTAGAKEQNPDVKVLRTFIGSWFDPAKTIEAAIAQVEQGADVLSAQAVGVIDAAIAKNVWALGAMTDQNHLGTDVVLTSVLWDLGPLVTAVGKAVEEGTWVSEAYSFGIPEGSISLADFHGLDKNVPEATLSAVNAKFDAIASGEFVVPLDTSDAQ